MFKRLSSKKHTLKPKSGFFKRILTGAMAVLIAMGSISGTTLLKVEAAEKGTITNIERIGNGFSFSHSIAGAFNPSNNHNYSPRLWLDNHLAYCIELGAPLNNGDSMEAYEALTPAKRELVQLAIMFGYNDYTMNDSNFQYRDYGVNAHMATQIMIWQIVEGTYDTGLEEEVLNTISTCSTGSPALVTDVYHSMKTRIKSYQTKPSFDGSTITLKYNDETGKYEGELTDSNKVLSGFSFKADGISVKRDGNKLFLSTDTAGLKGVKATAAKKLSSGGADLVDGNPTFWDGNTQQNVVTYTRGTSKGISSAFTINSESKGKMALKKTSDSGNVEGFTFRIKSKSTNVVKTTDKDGNIDISLPAGTYTVTEENLPDYFVQPKSQSVKITAGQTTEVSFSNNMKRGDLKVIKSSEDGFIEGVSFRLYGDSLSGHKIDMTVKTDKNGVAAFKDIPITANNALTIEEVDTAIRYVIPDAQNLSIQWDQAASLQFSNILKKFKVEGLKTDAETGKPQGDASLDGAVYGIYQGDKLIDRYTTHDGGKFSTSYYICGDNWYIQEISPSPGYLLDPTKYPVGAQAKNFKIELNTLKGTYPETVIKGKTAIIKHTDESDPDGNGDNQIEKPEEGAQFEIFLSAAGSYEKAAVSERDRLTTDENGAAITKLLPYGTYTVHQTAGAEGKAMVDDFTVFISENEKVYPFILRNDTFKSLIQIVKKDIETGKVIPASGIGFQIRDVESGELITQHINYPAPMDLDTFYTGSDGKLMLPEPLGYGDYELIEVQTADGYVLNSEPVSFTVDGTQKTVTVEKHNIAQKGIITLTKAGEIFQTVTEGKNIYTPVFSSGKLSGAEYDIIAAQDIVTLEGTVRAKAGDIVDTVTTDENGEAKSKELYLGNYTVLEKTAPDGMVLDKTEHLAVLTYAGQEVSVTKTDLALHDERQNAAIHLVKTWETDDIFGIGALEEYKNITFGLYAAEDLTAADGTVLPADGLIERISIDENGNGNFTTPIPFGHYYVKEFSTDEHFILSDAKYPIEFSYAGQDTAVVEISVNEGNAIENKLIRGSIVGKKVDEDGLETSGALFGLFKPGTTDFTEEAALMISISNEIGVFGFENVPYGDWIIRELQPAPGFLLNETQFPVTIKDQNEVINLEVENKFIRGSVQVTKVDAEYPENKLSGAEFEVFADVDGDKKFTEDIDISAGKLKETEPGIYQLDGLKVFGYFLRETKAPVSFKLDKEYHYFSIEKNEEIVHVETEAGKGFLNQPQKGILELTKTDVADGKLLANCGVEILDEEQNVNLQDKTDENGVVKFTLRPGKYFYREYDAPSGFQIDTKPYSFEVKEDGEIVKAKMTNEKLKKETPRENPEIASPVKTGDDTPYGLYGILAVVSLCTLVGTGYFLYRNRKNKRNKR